MIATASTYVLAVQNTDPVQRRGVSGRLFFKNRQEYGQMLKRARVADTPTDWLAGSPGDGWYFYWSGSVFDAMLTSDKPLITIHAFVYVFNLYKTHC